MEASRYVVQHTSRDVHTQLTAIWFHFKKFHVAVAINGFIVLDTLTNNRRNKLANRQNSDRFFVFFAVVNSYSVIDAFFIFQNERWVSDEPITEEHFKFFCVFWCIGPTSGRFNARLNDIHNTTVAGASKTIFAVTNDDTSVITRRDTTHDREAFFNQCAIHTGNNARCSHIGIFLTAIFDETCLNTFVSTKDHFLIKLTNGHPDTPWAGAVNDRQIRAVRAWWPGRARPMPYQSFLASFSKYVPKLFSMAVSGIDIIAYIIQAEWTLSIVTGNTMYVRIAPSRQRCPHWRCNSWMPAKHHKVFTLCAAFNKFLYVRHLTFTHHT